MSVTIRDAVPADIDTMVPLVAHDARLREASNPHLWRVAPDAADRIARSLHETLADGAPRIRHEWLVAERDGSVVGLAHSILLPVPPIYAGLFGPPGLIMEDTVVVNDAPDSTLDMLLIAAETDLAAAGAQFLLASSVPKGGLEDVLAAHNYTPLTRYLARSDLRHAIGHQQIRPAQIGDVADIVRLSAQHRCVLTDIDSFWESHPEAARRFGAWMEKSLTLTDRDMFVSMVDGDITGYAISQPATSLHFPPAHEIGAIGVIEDFHHVTLSKPESLGPADTEAAALFQAAEAARTARGNQAMMVVCPAAWTSKIALLEAEGYRNAITWYKKSMP